MTLVKSSLDALKSSHQKRVEEFMGRAGQHVPPTPTEPDIATRLSRARLIMEEALETINNGLGVEVYDLDAFTPVDFQFLQFRAEGTYDEQALADGCGDLSVVTVGTLSACGLPDKPILEAVDSANLNKFRGDAHLNEETGKWIKPTDWEPPDWGSVFNLIRGEAYQDD